MRLEDLGEITYDLEVDGELVRRELHKRTWERGAWATVAVVFEERTKAGAWAPKLALFRFQRAQGHWKKHALITLSGQQAVALGDSIEAWSGELLGTPEEEDE